MRGTSGRDAKIWRPLSRSTASAPDPAPAGAHLRGERRAGRARARGARGGGQEERGRGEQHGDEAERPSHRAVESRQPAGRGEVAVAFRLPSRDSRLDGQTAGPAPLARRDVRAARARAGARGADLAGRRVAGRRRGRDGLPADVATDSGGNSVAVWVASTGTGGEVRAAFRPAAARGARRRASTARSACCRTSRASPCSRDGEFVAVWLAQRRRHRAPLGAPSRRRRLERRRPRSAPSAAAPASRRCWRARTGR